MRTFILCIFVIHFIYACNATLCGGSPCPTGNACCNDLATGYRCYNPRLYSCVANDMNQTVLCAAKLRACGTACYNRSMYVCTEGEVLCGITSSGEKIKSCNGQCYNPKKYGCCQGKLVPPGTDKHCSPIAANVTTLFCSPFNQTACASGQWCCEGTCYDPKSQVCFQDQLCPIGNKVCGGVCYSPATQECCNNKAYAKGTSICSTATDPTCCSVSCNSTVVSAGSSLFTVSTHSQCNPTYTKSQFGSQLSCPSSTYQSCQSSSDSCENTINCGTNPLFLENCYGYNNSCSGSYLCGGGDYNTQIKSRSACPAPTSNSYESGHNKTLTSPGTSPYEYVPPAYAGKVCCWCAAPSEPIATSTIVPSYNNCNPAYVAANGYFDYPGATCRVWSRDLFDSQGLACGLPSE